MGAVALSRESLAMLHTFFGNLSLFVRRERKPVLYLYAFAYAPIKRLFAHLWVATYFYLHGNVVRSKRSLP